MTTPNDITARRGTVQAMLQGEALALDPIAARGLLTLQVHEAALPPDAPFAGAEMTGPLAVDVPRGERYAVSRRVAVMPVRGVLTPGDAMLERYFGWATYSGIEASCAELAANDDVSAVVLDMNTPGGYVRGVNAAADAIAALAAVKPVHVLVDPLAASAGYWLASQATDITMTAGSHVGSIGVMVMASWPVEPNAWGELESLHFSSHARAKWPDPTTDEGRAEIQRDLDASETEFHDAVASGRGIDRGQLTAQLSVTADTKDGGAVFGPKDAIARGLANGQATRAAFYDQIAATYAPAPQKSGSAAASLFARLRRARAIAKT